MTLEAVALLLLKRLDGPIDVVKKVFAWRSQRWTLHEIAEALNKESATRRGMRWQPRQVSRILEHRSLYRGRYAYAKTETKGQQEAILR
ncbi:hypothetical protein SMC6_03535 [Candidatus Cryosericum odellii]|uniref:Recombinase domain-containing protein n=1 Tax=Candidatus Cryosericum odellii TaxID=2290917 RepID=A0A398DCA2_9BACT|nr:hypothetical protein SMC6_03535 [Candidatus Cryosericum odellii]RIE11671.1 hypothetical protein SMC5_04100 [Candidatus Cryosericum odellii]